MLAKRPIFSAGRVRLDTPAKHLNSAQTGHIVMFSHMCLSCIRVCVYAYTQHTSTHNIHTNGDSKHMLMNFSDRISLTNGSDTDTDTAIDMDTATDTDADILILMLMLIRILMLILIQILMLIWILILSLTYRY
jgi:hypothetical protein